MKVNRFGQDGPENPDLCTFCTRDTTKCTRWFPTDSTDFHRSMDGFAGIPARV